jgi:hypothetical protein
MSAKHLFAISSVAALPVVGAVTSSSAEPADHGYSGGPKTTAPHGMVGQHRAARVPASRSDPGAAYAKFVPMVHPDGYECVYQGGPKSPIWHIRRM